MTHTLALEIDLARQSKETQYLVLDCAHQVQQVLDRFKSVEVIGRALDLVQAQRFESVAG